LTLPALFVGFRCCREQREQKPTATMNITITSKSINNGKQHVLRIPFIGTFTVDQKDVSRAISFVLANGKNESSGFMNAIAIR
jgi:hypothetical protein